MNKTIAINLGGSVFNIEEEAYAILKSYLDSIKANFIGDPTAGEIMADIEARIAEIFHEMNSVRKNVVTREDIEAMMSIMGKPEDYRMDEPAGNAEPAYDRQTRNSRRKIFRDTDDAVIAGVCSGLSHYFGWDPLVIRLIILVLTIVSFGFPGVLGYIIFWALVPPARTTAEKLQMRGEQVNIENIGKFVNEETKAAANRVNKFGRQAGTAIRNSSGDFLRGMGRVLAVIFGIIILFMGLGLLGSLFSLIVFSEFSVFGFDSTNWELMDAVFFHNDGTLWVLVIGVVLAMGAPAITLIYTSIRLMTGSNRRIKGLAISLLSLFIVGVLLCIYGGVKTGKQFSRDAELTSSSILPVAVNDTLHFEVSPDTVFIGRNGRNNEFFDLVKMGDDKIYYGEPLNVHFEPTSAPEFKAVIRKRSNGRNMEQAGVAVRGIEYNYTASNDSIILDPYFTTPKDHLYRGQHVEMVVYVPIGRYVTFGKNASFLTWFGQQEETFLMDEDGLMSEEDQKNERAGKREAELDRLHELELNGNPHLKVTEDSVIIHTPGLEIKTRRD